MCGGSAAGTHVQIAKLLRQLPEIADAVLTGQVGQASAAVLTRLIGKIDLEQLLASQAALIEVVAGRDPQALGLWVRELIATHCEPQLDHGGTTDLGNLVLLCKRHHVMWHQGRLQLRDLHAPWLHDRPNRPPQLVLLD